MSDKEGPSWVDYANLGANIASAGQLIDVRSKLSHLAEIEAAREERRKLEEQLRQFVFDSESGIQNSHSLREVAPRGSLVALRYLEQAFDQFGIDPSSFQRFEDKDRVKEARQRLSKAIEITESLLPADKLDEVNKYITYSNNLEGLDRLIHSERAQQRLEEMDDDWQNAFKRHQKARRVGLFTTLGSLGAFFTYPILLLAVGNVLPFLAETQLYCLLGAGGWTLLGILLLVGFIGFVNAGPKEYKVLRLERLKLEPQVLDEEEERVLRGFFGDGRSIDAYQSLRDDIVAYIQHVTTTGKSGEKLDFSTIETIIPSF